jgi:hypothetical protein
MTRRRRNPLKVTYSAKGRKVIVPVMVDASGIHVEPVVEIPWRAANVEIVWTLKTPRSKGWKFTDKGIRIEPGDGSARLAHLLVRRDEHLIGLLTKSRAESSIRAEMERDYEKFVSSGHGQFHSPRNEGTRFVWKDYNDYRELYEYSIEVTDGTTTMTLDPAIKNQGC